MVDAATIAADVAARYGVAVCPSVVQFCPPMTCTASTPVWNEKIRQLVYPDSTARKVQFKKAIWAGAVRAKGNAATPAILDRRDVVLRLHGEGLHNAAIAARTGVSPATIGKDVAMLGLRANAAPAVPRDASQIKLATLTAMRDAGDSLEVICAFLGLKPDTVRRMARQIGKPFSTRTVWQGQAAATQRRVMEMKVVGMACDAIAAELRMQPNSVRRIALRAGAPFAKVANTKAGTAARRDEVLRRQAEGQLVCDIAQAMGLVDKSVYRIASRAGSPFARVVAAAAPKLAKAPKPPRAAKVKAARPSRAKAVTIKTVLKVRYQPIERPGQKQIKKEARQAKVKDLKLRGFGFLEICAILDVGKSTIHRDLTDLEMITNSRWKKPLLRDLETRAA